MCAVLCELDCRPLVCIHARSVDADRASEWQEVRIRCVVSATGRCKSFLHHICRLIDAKATTMHSMGAGIA